MGEFRGSKGMFRGCERGDISRLRTRPTFGNSAKSRQKHRKKPKVSSLPCALCRGERLKCLPHVRVNLPVSFRQRTVSATAPLPLTGLTNNDSVSTVAAHERQRRRRAVSSSYGTTTTVFCERAVKGCKFAYCRSALRKCKNAVFAGVLSPISFAVERNGAAGGKKDKHIRRHGQKYLASGDAKLPHSHSHKTTPIPHPTRSAHPPPRGTSRSAVRR